MADVLEFQKKISLEELVKRINEFYYLDEAYNWASQNINQIYINPHGYRLEIDMIFSIYERHMSAYYQIDKPMIYRSYNIYNGNEYYNYVSNGSELMEKNPELMRYLIRNGEYAYLHATQPDLAKMLKY